MKTLAWMLLFIYCTAEYTFLKHVIKDADHQKMSSETAWIFLVLLVIVIGLTLFEGK